MPVSHAVGVSPAGRDGEAAVHFTINARGVDLQAAAPPLGYPVIDNDHGFHLPRHRAGAEAQPGFQRLLKDLCYDSRFQPLIVECRDERLRAKLIPRRRVPGGTNRELPYQRNRPSPDRRNPEVRPMSTHTIEEPGLLLHPGPPGNWDDERVSGPRVLRQADGIWLLWYYGRDRSFDRQVGLPTGRIGLARSEDGLNWQRVAGPGTRGAVLDPHPDPRRFDSTHVGVGSVTRDETGFRLWYFGGDEERFRFGRFEVKGLRLRIGCARSTDGIQWQRIDGPHRGALLDVGPPGAFDQATCGWPRVLRLPDGRWRMYYHGLDPERMQFAIGAAESDDGLAWQRLGEIFGSGEPGAFDETGVTLPELLPPGQHGGSDWRMLYQGVCRDGHRSIGLAASPDGLYWSRVPGAEPGGAVFAHAPSGSGRWDAFAVGTPCVVPMPDGRFRLYYSGADEVPSGFADELAMVQQIGLAISDGADLTRWRRWERGGDGD
ncbi:MAG: glycosyl hydrolase [Thiohalocapsa sp.]|uniref:glycosyl hydrolase n=1 Tax=Thiohalocapsa sp. TaxID=2497641 RepID=UPI0025F209A9|nr:glycosyl hydrolase [Thiohalocapsa sp.]MCG6940318.1 glycosyl hydrolase [Thiohalocapsa sp.]